MPVIFASTTCTSDPKHLNYTCCIKQEWSATCVSNSICSAHLLSDVLLASPHLHILPVCYPLLVRSMVICSNSYNNVVKSRDIACDRTACDANSLIVFCYFIAKVDTCMPSLFQKWIHACLRVLVTRTG